MTLARQLDILVAALAVLAFVAGTLIGVGSARSLLDAQLAQRARTALEGLEQSAAAGGDPVVLARAVEVLAASGCCEYVRVGMPGSPARVERSVSPTVPSVAPHWFATLFPVGQSAVRGPIRGVPDAEIEVRPARATAYDDLWLAAGAAALYAGLSAAVLVIAGWLGVRALLAPLRVIEANARSVLDGRAAGPLPAARAVDLECVGRALGTLGRKFEQMLQGAQGLALALREQVATDPLTGLASRRRLLDVLAFRRHNPERGRGGMLMLVQVEGLSGLNESLGYAAGDDLLRDVAAVLTGLFGTDSRNLVAHLAGADFAVLLEDLGEREAGAVEDATVRALADLRRIPDTGWITRVRVGSAPLSGQSVSALFADADRALRTPRVAAVGSAASGRQAAVPTGAEARPEGGADDLDERVSLVFQPVVAAGSRVLLHEEAFARVRTPAGGEPVPAGEFLAAATGSTLAVALDRAVVRAALGALGRPKAGVSVAVNLTPATVRDGAAFTDWLSGLCRQAPDEARRLLLEIPEHCLPEAADGLRAMASGLAPFGVALAIDHLGMGFGALGCLRAAPLHYVKIDGSFSANLERDPQSQFFVRAIAQIAHGLDIAVLLEAVEAEGVWAMLPELQVDGGQGYHLGRPA
jgi:diguanylate cyclase (GGDEF)-like protein